MKNKKIIRKKRRKIRIRSKIVGTAKRPRLSVYRSNRYIYAQLIDDSRGETLVSFSEKQILQIELSKLNKTQKANIVGESLAKKALKKKIKSVLFDRSGYKYHGRVKALAEGVRKGGVKI